MMKVSGIYVIVNTKNGKVYIGQTVNFSARWKTHSYNLTNGTHVNRHLQAAWNKYKPKAFKFKILEYCEVGILDEREQHYLNAYMPKDMCYNVALDVRASRRGAIISEETRRKLSKAHKGKVLSEDHRHKLSKAHKGKVLTKDHRRKIGEANKGRIVTDETRRKIGEKSKNISKETRLKMSEARKNISPETRRKLSEASKNRSTETRRKLSDANKRRPPISQETRQRLSEAQKKRPPMSAETRRKISEAATRREAQRRQQVANMPTEGLTP